ncbi:hypothetical protein FC961_11975 [Clostridium botulinum]|nr:hypothetical protein [Clostridium botulinum]
MNNKEIEIIDLTNKQYKELITVQKNEYKKVLKFCIDNIKDIEKIKEIEGNLEIIDKNIINQLEDIELDNEKFIEYLEK